MKKYFAILASMVMLSACAVIDAPKDDEMDDTMQEETASSADAGAMMEEAASSDTGTVNGNTTEDAGGDGTIGTVKVDVKAPPASAASPRVIAISADTWSFTPSTITAKKGEKVTLQITAVNGTHGFAVPDIGLNATVAAGQTTTVTLPTDKIGTFGGFCSVPCGAGHKDMRVTVIISE